MFLHETGLFYVFFHVKDVNDNVRGSIFPVGLCSDAKRRRGEGNEVPQ